MSRKDGGLPRNRKLWHVRVTYPNEGGDTSSSFTTPMTEHDAQKFCEEMRRERPDIQTVISICDKAVREYEAEEVERKGHA